MQSVLKRHLIIFKALALFQFSYQKIYSRKNTYNHIYRLQIKQHVSFCLVDQLSLKFIILERFTIECRKTITKH